MQLNKYMAQTGFCSRRKAVNIIKNGLVTVNNAIITDPGYQVKPRDVVKVQGQVIKVQKLVHILMNKPKDYITTVSDERGRRTVLDLIGDAVKQRVYPVGRLDRNTTGLLLLTNDGDLAQKLAHPRYQVEKVYQVTLDKPVTAADVKKIKSGIKLSDGIIQVDALYYAPGKRKNCIQVALHSGKYRIVRRIFEHLGYKIISLDRIVYAGLTKRGLPRGSWRFLTQNEVMALKN